MHVWFGSQVFSGAWTFNANIGAWNTASVLNMADVCAASVCGTHISAGCARSV